jgi:hypothetical protein
MLTMAASGHADRKKTGMLLKTCSKCGEALRIREFARDRSKASGRKSHCKACDREKARRYYEANRERKLAYMAERNAALREARGWRRRERWSPAKRALAAKIVKAGDGPCDDAEPEAGAAA